MYTKLINISPEVSKFLYEKLYVLIENIAEIDSIWEQFINTSKNEAVLKYISVNRTYTSSSFAVDEFSMDDAKQLVNEFNLWLLNLEFENL